MKRKGGKYTYVPKDEIAEVRTFNDVSFENDDLLDGAYVRGRKRKFKHGGMTHKRPMSLEEQAAESVGYDTWYMMDAVDQKELVDELVSTGMIAPMYGWGGKMADGGTIPMSEIKDFKKYVKEFYGKGEIYQEFFPKSGATNVEIDKAVNMYVDYASTKEDQWGGGDSFDREIVRDIMLYNRGSKKALEFEKVVKKVVAHNTNSPESIWKSTKPIKRVKMLVNASENKYTSDELVDFSYLDWSSLPKGIRSKLEKDIHKYADGGLTDSEREGAIEEASKIATFAIDNDITASGKSLKDFSNEIFEASGISYGISYLRLAYDALLKNNFADGGDVPIDEAREMLNFYSDERLARLYSNMKDLDYSDVLIELKGNKEERKEIIEHILNTSTSHFADGGVVSYVVKYSMKDTPEIVKEKVFADKDAAELFHETISDDEDLVVMDLQEIKPAPAAAPKKSLFASAKPAPATTAAAKKKRERVQVDGIEDEIARYDQLKATINNAKAEQEVIGGRLKEIGREKFLELYEQRGVRPANFDLADGDQNILLEVTDKYLKVEPEKAELLRQFDGLLEEKTTYEFDSELLEKEVSEGMTIGDVISMLIQDSKLIPENDKANLIKAKMSMRVPKGTIDRLMDYDNPREVFSLISPILALK